MAKTVKVTLPLDQPDHTLKLAKDIFDQHTALGLLSPLTGFVDMAAFDGKRSAAAALRSDGDKRTQNRQRKYNDASMMAGVGEGQTQDTENTVRWYVQKVRNTLRNKFKGTEEAMSEFGFNVVISQTGARKNVRVDMPESPEDMVELAEDILEEHASEGVGSPLTGTVDTTTLGTLTTGSRTLLNEWFTVKNQAQSYHNQALVIIGYGEGQTSFTAGTIYYDLCSIRDRLLDVHQGHEEALSEYGFEVKISHSKKPKKVEAQVLEVVLNLGNIGNFNLSSINEALNKVKIEAIGSNGRLYAASNPGNLPGPGAFLDVAAGNSAQMTKAELITLVGLNGITPYLNVQNTSAGQGLYRITFSK